jgi:hypothetical protein
MHFERLELDLKERRLVQATVGEEGLYGGGRVQVAALGKEDVAWVVEVAERVRAALQGGPRFVLEGEVEEGEVRYTLVEGARRAPFAGLEEGARAALRAELDDVLSALSGLVEIY